MTNRLEFNVFTAPAKALVGERPRPFGEPFAFDAGTSTLIYGEYDAVLVDAFHTTAEAAALADWVALHHRNLTTIYITHGHLDHYFGLTVLLDRFPTARAIATPGTVAEIRAADPDMTRVLLGLLPGQVVPNITAPQPYDNDTITLEGRELRIIEQGRTDFPHSTSLHVPSIDLVVAGDVLYNKCHMYVGETTADSRDNWIAALDRLAALQPKYAVAGHKKTGEPDTPDAIAQSQNYLRHFSRLQRSGLSDQELFDEMGERFPDWVSHQSWLMFGFS
ncbi:MBL fold metallo-hydrolase [Nocardia sp. NPDC052254]|uniref:MBL fold metallo-hydrolase n=1 Tax=Nocardia sp. NPDC052254 TaxID=3155681 RepID=UPI003416E86E